MSHNIPLLYDVSNVPSERLAIHAVKNCNKNPLTANLSSTKKGWQFFISLIAKDAVKMLGSLQLIAYSKSLFQSQSFGQKEKSHHSVKKRWLYPIRFASTTPIGEYKPSKTALMVAWARQDEDPLAYGLLSKGTGLREQFGRDVQQFARHFSVAGQSSPITLKGKTIESRLKSLLDKIASPYYRELYAGRVWYVDKLLDKWIQTNESQGKKSIIILPGAGADTKAIRYAQKYPEKVQKNIAIIEFDTPETQKHKANSIRKLKTVPHHQLVSVNYAKGSDQQQKLKASLKEAYKQLGEKSLENINVFVSIEGVSYYLTQEQNKKLFHMLSSELPKGTQVFTDWYRHDGWDRNPEKDPQKHPYRQFLKTIGEPVRFTTNDFARDILQSGKRFSESTQFDPLRSRGSIAAQRLKEHTKPEYYNDIGLQEKLESDAFGNLSQFSVFEVR